MRSITVALALSAQQAAGLALPSSTPTTGAVSPAANAAPLGRRQAIATAFSAAAVLCAERVNAYDAIPVVEADFAEMEKLRAARLAKSDKKTKELRQKLMVIKKTDNAKDFIEAADDMAVWVIGEGAGARAVERDVPRGTRARLRLH